VFPSLTSSAPPGPDHLITHPLMDPLQLLAPPPQMGWPTSGHHVPDVAAAAASGAAQKLCLLRRPGLS